MLQWLGLSCPSNLRCDAFPGVAKFTNRRHTRQRTCALRTDRSVRATVAGTFLSKHTLTGMPTLRGVGTLRSVSVSLTKKC